MKEPHAQYLIEFIVMDHTVKVSALEPQSGIEASVICPATTTRRDMIDLAVRKLQYVLKKHNAPQ